MPENQEPGGAWARAEVESAAARPRASVLTLVAIGSVFGVVSGPLLSAVANHGRPVLGSLIAAPVLLVLGALFCWALVVLDRQPWRTALLKAVAVLVGGGLLFMLPHFLALPAPGDFWWRTDAERYAVYCTPYPVVAWLAFSRAKNRWTALATCTALAACLVAAWPKLLVGARAQTAAVLRAELGLPAASLYTVGITGAHPTDGYYADGTTVSIAYELDGYTHPTSTYTDVSVSEGQTTSTTYPTYIGYDLALTVYPATNSSPCTDVVSTLFWVLPDEFTGGSDGTCEELPNGRWQYAETSEPKHVTQIERVGGYYVVLTVNLQATGLADQFPQLFAGLHHPNAAELVAIGLSGDVPSPVE